MQLREQVRVEPPERRGSSPRAQRGALRNSRPILVVDDDADSCEMVAAVLETRGFEASWKTNGADALLALSRDRYGVVVTDLQMPALSGLELCECIVANHPETQVVVLTGFGSMNTAIAAIRAGAYDFLTKPLELEHLVLVLERALRVQQLEHEIKRLRDSVNADPPRELTGESSAMRAMFAMLERIGDSPASVLVTGESGTGKELVARALHRQSGRQGRFVALNCAAMPEQLLETELFGHTRGAFTDANRTREGLFREADGGTLFLDEIGDMPVGLQAKLLRALQERKVRPVGGDREYEFDARIISATNQDLESAVERGDFREDLFFRLNVIHMTVPPLRTRGKDILLLAQEFVTRFAERARHPVRGLSRPAVEKLLAYSWPGNVRELENCIERAVTMAHHDHLLVDDLPEKVRDYQVSHIIAASDDPADLVTMDEVEERYIRRVLSLVNGNKSQAAKILGFDRRTLYRRLQRYDIT